MKRSYLDAIARMGLWPMSGTGCGNRHAMSEGNYSSEEKTSERKGAIRKTGLSKKEIFMQRTIAATALFVASILITTGAWAQSVTATVPFDFTINNNTVVPTGTYIITSAPSTDHHVLSISDEKTTFRLSSAMPNPASGNNTSVLVFHRYGDRYFLYQIWVRGEERGRQIPPTSVERELASNRRPNSVAVLAAK